MSRATPKAKSDEIEVVALQTLRRPVSRELIERGQRFKCGGQELRDHRAAARIAPAEAAEVK